MNAHQFTHFMVITGTLSVVLIFGGAALAWIERETKQMRGMYRRTLRR